MHAQNTERLEISEYSIKGFIVKVNKNVKNLCRNKKTVKREGAIQADLRYRINE